MKIHTYKLNMSIPQSAPENQPSAQPLIDRTLVERNWKLQSRSQRLLVEHDAPVARIRPPRNRRIYSDNDLKLATEMFKKLSQGEDRRPHPSAVEKEIKPVDPVDRVVDVLLQLFEL